MGSGVQAQCPLLSYNILFVETCMGFPPSGKLTHLCSFWSRSLQLLWREIASHRCACCESPIPTLCSEPAPPGNKHCGVRALLRVVSLYVPHWSHWRPRLPPQGTQRCQAGPTQRQTSGPSNHAAGHRMSTLKTGQRQPTVLCVRTESDTFTLAPASTKYRRIASCRFPAAKSSGVRQSFRCGAHGSRQLLGEK